MISKWELQYQDLLYTSVCILSCSANFPVEENCPLEKWIPESLLCYQLETLTEQSKKKKTCHRKILEQRLCTLKDSRGSFNAILLSFYEIPSSAICQKRKDVQHEVLKWKTNFVSVTTTKKERKKEPKQNGCLVIL